MSITAVYSGRASINVTPMNFGNVGDSANTKHYGVATILYQGLGGNVITIGPGQNLSTSTSSPCNGTRCLADDVDPNWVAGGNHGLAYQLYKDPAHTQIWGDGTTIYTGSTTAPTGVTTLLATTGLPFAYTVYGMITGTGVPAALGATFNDTVQVTIQG